MESEIVISEEKEKYILFELELSKDNNNFIKKIKEIFKVQYFEKLQDILILQKHQFLEQVQQEVLYILKKLYSNQIISNPKFNDIFKLSFQDFESKYNSDYREIHSKFDFFLKIKTKSIKTNNQNDIEALNPYYIHNFRKHCLNQYGPALHKCGHAEKGKFIKILVNLNNKNKNNSENMYIICEECKKVFLKDFFNNYCSFCKESYLCSILPAGDNKDNFLITYSHNHCDTFINRTIPCKLCREKLYIFITDKKIKCLKCNYVLDIENKTEFNWQCPKCNKYFSSNIKLYNPSESLILTRIIKKALLLKIKAKPQFLNCCNIDVNKTPFFHKKECKGLLYLCNVENYFLKNKKWAIICEKCQAINNCKNFIWTCPKCGKRTRENSFDNYNFDFNFFKNEEQKNSNINNNYNNDDKKYKSPIKKESINMNKNNNDDNNDGNFKNRLNKRYLSEYSLKKQSGPSYLRLEEEEDNSKKIENGLHLRKSVNEKKREITLISRMNRVEKDTLKLNLIKSEQINENNNINTNNNQIKNSIYNRRRNYIITVNNKIQEKDKEKEKNKIDINDDKGKEKEKEKEEKINKNGNILSIPLSKSRYLIKKNNASNVKEEEKNNEKKILRCESYKSSIIKENLERNKIIKINNEAENIKNFEKNNSALKVNNRGNVPIRIKYNKNKKEKEKEIFDELNNNINDNNNIIKNEDEFIVKKNLILSTTSIDGGGCNSKTSSNDNNRITKETSHNSKGSITSLNKDININNINTSSKITNNNCILNLKQSESTLNLNNNNKDDKDNFIRNSVSPNYNYSFKNKRKYYIKEKDNKQTNNKEQSIDNYNNNKIINEKNTNDNIVKIYYNNNKTPNILINKYNRKNFLNPSNKLTFIEKRQIEFLKEETNNDKPDDVIEPKDVDYNEDIQINDPKIIKNKELYNKIQSGVKKILEKGHLPRFNIDNYTIEKKIGDGAFGVLFSVSNNKTNKKYALKKLTATDLNSLEEFQKEFEIAYNNEHENILNLYGICIRVYDVTTYVLFVLMDLAEHDWEIEIINRYKEKRYYTEDELIQILKQLSNACVYLQKKEIAHRDIKPENILLFYDEKNEKRGGGKGESSFATYKICDFGEAKEKIKVGSRHKSIRGTDFYMSPILFKGLMEESKFVRDNPYKSDVFSLGYCMVIAGMLDFEFINKIRKLEEQREIDKIIREALEKRYSYKFIYVLLKMITHSEKERIDFIGLERLIKDKL